jgi:ankyrin repeat protein
MRQGLVACLLALCCSVSATADDIGAYREALKAGDATRLRVLVAEARGDLPLGSRGETVLHLATNYLHAENREQLVRVLLDAGAPIEARDGSGSTPLHWAAGYGCVPCVALLLAHGAKVNATRNDGGTPLHRAQASTVPTLLAAGANVRAKDRGGRVPLHTSLEPLEALLAAGVDVRDAHGLTPLHYAALAGNAAQVDWLLAKGASPGLASLRAWHFNGDEPADSWEPRHLFPIGTRAYDMAKWGHERTRWSSGQYRPVLERLDAVTPRRGLFRR